MSAKITTEVKVGFVSFLAIVLFVVGMTLGRGCNVTVTTTKIMMRFPSSGGIQPTAPILINGVKRGTVLNIVNNNGSVLISAEIDEMADIRKDATARISMMEITGGKKIDIAPGISPDKFNPSTGVITGTTSADLSDLVTMMGDISNEARFLLKKLDSIAGETLTILGDKEFIDRFKNTLKTTDEIATSINQLVNANKNDIQVTLNNIKTITGDLKLAIKKNEPRLDTILYKLDYTIGQSQGVLSNANTAITDADGLIKDLKAISAEIRTGQGIAGKIIFDKELGNKLDSTLTVLQKYLSIIAEHGINVNTRLGSRP